MMKNIIITGGCGFIGSNFILNQLSDTKNLILNIDNLSYAGNTSNLKSIEKNKNYFFIEGDITDFNFLKETFFEFKPDYVVNFAAETHVDRSIDNPSNFISTNIFGTAKLLDASLEYVRISKKKSFKFLHISTDEVYGSLDKKGYFNEMTPYAPSSPYSASKASSDHLVNAWFKTYKLPTIVTNCSNNYGPYQYPEKLIPLIIANCFDELPLPVYGKGSNVRDWLHVYDHCSAINKVLKLAAPGKSYNIGGNTEISNIEVIKTICNYFDLIKPRKNGKKYDELITYVDDRPGHDFRYAVDSSKIKRELGWKPIENFDTGIRKTIDWYLKNEQWWRDIKYKQERLGLINI